MDITCNSIDSTKDEILRPINSQVMQILEEQRKEARAEADELRKRVNKLNDELAESKRANTKMLQEKEETITNMQINIDLLQSLQNEQDEYIDQSRERIESLLEKYSKDESMTQYHCYDFCELLHKLDAVLDASSVEKGTITKNTDRATTTEGTQTDSVPDSKDDLDDDDSFYLNDTKTIHSTEWTGTTEPQIRPTYAKDDPQTPTSCRIWTNSKTQLVQKIQSYECIAHGREEGFTPKATNVVTKQCKQFLDTSCRSDTKMSTDCNHCDVESSMLSTPIQTTKVLTISSPINQSYHIKTSQPLTVHFANKASMTVEKQTKERVVEDGDGKDDENELRSEYEAMKDCLIDLLMPRHKIRGKSKQFQRKMWKEESARYLMNIWTGYYMEEKNNWTQTCKSLKTELKDVQKRIMRKQEQYNKLREDSLKFKGLKESFLLEVKTLHHQIESIAIQMETGQLKLNATEKECDDLRSANEMLKTRGNTKDEIIKKLLSKAEQEQLRERAVGEYHIACSGDYSKLRGLVKKFNSKVENSC